ncbi:hypothetical protein EYF80_039594 [Liparis tanakae]|uniref:Uncharacterized protein n=1 Tax=Liparis tanakae TaxID=230148 RepID=A0A4Z2GAB7_9TELE|nr:hypothetical protein EYF80_039594 [Liparis tanakae]
MAARPEQGLLVFPFLKSFLYGGKLSVEPSSRSGTLRPAAPRGQDQIPPIHRERLKLEPRPGYADEKVFRTKTKHLRNKMINT